eukprot:6325734-Alexandrium_andersonii.AAC.1
MDTQDVAEHHPRALQGPERCPAHGLAERLVTPTQSCAGEPLQLVARVQPRKLRGVPKEAFHVAVGHSAPANRHMSAKL